MKKACIIGWPVKHSRSPLIHGHWLAKHGIDGVYTKLEVVPEALTDFIRVGMASQGFAGCNVTIPHKVAVMTLVDDVSPAARAIGAVNTLWFEGGGLRADNTDVTGFMTHLAASAPGWQGPDRSALVLGAGGGARGVVYGLLRAGVERIHICNRTRAKADEIAAAFGSRVVAVEWAERERFGRDAGVVVNTTSLGMHGYDELMFDVANLPPDCVVADIVYVPLETKLLAAARLRGLRTVDGLGMLLHQAVPGFERWFGVRPTVTAELRDLIVRDIEGRQCC